MKPMSDPDRALVLNPASTAGATDRIRRLAGRRGFRVRETGAAGDAARLASEAVRDGATLVGAAGGDGTLNGVVNGIAAADALGDVTVGVVPSGTANVFATYLDIRDIARSFSVLERGRDRRFDLGRLRPGGRYFLSCVLGGPAAAATQRTTRRWKRYLGRYAYLGAMLREGVRYEPLRVTASIGADATADGRHVWEGDAAVVLVANARRAPGRVGIPVDPADGEVDLVVLAHARPTAMAAGCIRLGLGGTSRWLHHYTASHLRLDVDGDPTPFSVDGESIERSQVAIDVCPRRARIRIPADATVGAVDGGDVGADI